MSDIPKIPTDPDTGTQAVIDLKTEITSPFFDEKEFFAAEIRPLIQKLIALCHSKSIPFVCGVNMGNYEDKGMGICFVSGLPGARTPMAFRVFTDAMRDKSQTILKGMMLGASMMHAAENGVMRDER